MKFAEMILTERKSRKLSQEDMGFDLNVSTQTVNFWERGIRSPRLDEAKRIADILGYEINFVKKEQEEIIIRQNEKPFVPKWANYETCKDCPYYYGEVNQCMFGEECVSDNLEKKCEKGAGMNGN